MIDAQLQTVAEDEIMEQLGDIYNRIVALPGQHPSDGTELAFHIHAIQSMVAARRVWREKGSWWVNRP